MKECSEFTKLNFLRGGYDACGELNEKDRHDTSRVGHLDREDADWLRNEDIYNSSKYFHIFKVKFSHAP